MSARDLRSSSQTTGRTKVGGTKLQSRLVIQNKFIYLTIEDFFEK